MIVLLIPVYEPGPEFEDLIHKIYSVFDQRLETVLVNDGSSEETVKRITKVSLRHPISVVHHTHNLGKGEALKTGLREILKRFPNAETVVTADADGQHRAEDIYRVAKSSEMKGLVLGSRDLNKAIVPWKSYLGNAMIRFLFRRISKITLVDTQTGLRAFSLSAARDFLQIRSHGYEFEMNTLLLSCQKGLHIVEVPIETIYFEQNRRSHFHPIVDAFKIVLALLVFRLRFGQFRN